ncbi:MAG TPA: M1 family aminopeptidase [Gemmatimonadaceae bacterium]|nr:M1 family aminopeptidase [Gemmatimonadaceae bacterium]
MRPVRWTAALAAALALGACAARATVEPPPMLAVGKASAPTPDSLGALFLNAFAGGSLAAFDSVDPDSLSRAVMHAAIQRKMAREPNTRRVVWQSRELAVLLLTGTVKAGNGGDEANLVRHFSGFYQAVQYADGWHIASQLPIDSLNHIHGQILHVELAPGRDIHVEDTISIVVGSDYGLAVRLNNDVRIARLRVDGDSVAWSLGGGVLWMAAPKRDHAQLTLSYWLRDSSRPSHEVAAAAGDSMPAYGAFHNTDAWHPFFDYNSANDLGPATMTVHLPAEYYLTTTLPQHDTVAGGVRTVIGQSTYPTWLLSLIYDRDWRPVSSDVRGVQFVTFTTPSFHFSHDSLAAELRPIDSVLNARFGGPNPPYIAAVEDRGLGPRGFMVRMTDAVVSGSKADVLVELGTRGPSFVFAHEVSHAWTMNATGPAANMLREGWATFAESVMLRAMYGDSVEQDYWNRLRNGYMLGSEDRISILGSPDNGSVHYSKGAWIFHMFDEMLGEAAFDRGIREYVQRQVDGKPAGYQELIAAMSHAAKRDLTSFAMPWFSEKVVPDVRAEVQGHQLIVSQVQATPPFDLPLDVALTLADGGTIHRTVRLTTRADTVALGKSDSVTAVHIDPKHHLLLQRHWGQHVRLELPVSQAAGDTAVAIVGDFTLDSVPATREGDKWVVTLPLTEGRYVYSWQINGKPRSIIKGGNPGTDGDPATTGAIEVRPLEPLTDGLPKGGTFHQ